MSFAKSDSNFIKCGGKLMKFEEVTTTEEEEDNEPTQKTDIIEDDLDIQSPDLNMNLD